MRMNRVRGPIADRPIDIPVFQGQNTGVERPAVPLSFMDRVAAWLNSQPEKIRTIKPSDIPSYTKGKSSSLDEMLLRLNLGQVQSNQEDNYPISEPIESFDLLKDPNKKYLESLINLGYKYQSLLENTDSDLDQIKRLDLGSYFNEQNNTDQRQRINRVIGEFELLCSRFGSLQFDENNPTSVYIERFDLPKGFNHKYSELMIELGYKYPTYPPKDWYLSRGLRKKGRKSSHYFEEGFGAKPFCKRGFAWYSFHIKRWRPNSNSMITGDNLLTAVQAFYEALRSD